jgi:hypothetical protein
VELLAKINENDEIDKCSLFLQLITKMAKLACKL